MKAVRRVVLFLLVPFTLAKLQRTASFTGHGDLHTTRKLTVSLDAASHEEQWLLGLPPSQEQAVADELASVHGRLLHVFPGPPGDDRPQHHHWVVRASKEALQALLHNHEDVTMAKMPDHFKLSTSLRMALASAEAAGSSGDNASSAFHADRSHQDALGHEVTLRALMPNTTHEERTALAALVVQGMTALGDRMGLPEPQVTRSGLRLGLSLQVLEEVTTWLSGQASVTWLDVEPTALQLTNRHGGAAAAKASQPLPAPALHDHTVQSAFRPFWKAGLDGRGQVVGVVDSGLDMDSCYFWDPVFKDYQQSTSTIPSLNNVTMFSNATHRKVTMYVFAANSSIDEVGHGTHVAATIVGSAYGRDPLQSDDLATGVAPAAKVAFVDVLGPGQNGNYKTEQGPGLWAPLHEAGARVTCNSWSSHGYGYQGLVCHEIDAHTWEHQDSLHVFAAGNAGFDTSFLPTTGTSSAPGTCKNILSVGATEFWIPKGVLYLSANLSATTDEDLWFSENWLGPWAHGSLTFQSPDGLFNHTLHSNNRGYAPLSGMDSQFKPLLGGRCKLEAADPLDGCSPLKKGPQSRRRRRSDVILLVRGRHSEHNRTCTAAQAAAHVAASGAAAALVFWEDRMHRSVTVSPGGRHVGKDGRFPAAIIRSEAGEHLLRTLDMMDIWVTWAADEGHDKGTAGGGKAAHGLDADPPEHVAFFSGYASAYRAPSTPTKPNITDASAEVEHDARYKPDLTAPGYTVAAASDRVYSGEMDQCMVSVQDGTSMAAPVVAGAAALVRQYFTEGFYPSGSRSPQDAFDPSGPLVKAVLIAGAAAMQGVSRANNQPLQPPPSPFQGHGRLDLAAALPLEGDGSGCSMQVVDQAVFHTHNVTHTYTFRLGPGPAPLTVALVWHDPPPHPGSHAVLVNDLDLTVQGPAAAGGAKRKHNHLHWGNGRKGGDRYNNVEKVFIPRPRPGSYQVTVSSVYLFIAARPQLYSLVILGPLQEGTLDSKHNPDADSPGPERVLGKA